MKVHYNGIFGLVCNTNRTRRTSHTSRITTDIDKVTCLACRKWYRLDGRDKAEYEAYVAEVYAKRAALQAQV
jgi:hypothetical protein